MPAGEYHEPQEVLDHIYQLIENNQGSLGLNYVAYAEEQLLPKYPVVVVSVGNFERQLVASHKFALVFIIELWVLHANLNQSHKARTQEDMAMVTAIKTLLDSNATLANAAAPAGNIIFGYVQHEAPGIMTRSKGEAVVSTRMVWIGEGRQNFT